MKLGTLKSAILAGVAATPLMLGAAFAQSAPGDKDVIIVTGTRVADRTALDTAVAVDVVGSEELEKGGVTEINQALAVALPSFNFPRPALNAGPATGRPAPLWALLPASYTTLPLPQKRQGTNVGDQLTYK